MGNNFKSDIIFHDMPGNTNGKMSLQGLQRSNLGTGGKALDPWSMEGYDFVLEEDGDSGYSKVKTSNIFRIWKEENKLDYFFNSAPSPDLSPIKNCWQPPKQRLAKYPYWDDCTTEELIL